MINWLSKQEIINIHSMILVPGEPDGFLNESNLDASLYSLQYYENEPLVNLAGLLLWKLTKGHIFQQGNKRTAVASTVLFLNLNNVDVAYQYSGSEDDPLYQLTINIAMNSIEDIEVGQHLVRTINFTYD
jgi:death-on-curing protein